jgi:hypothetical protein
MNVPCSSTPAESRRSATCHASILPSTFSTVSASTITVFSELNHTAHAFAVYASWDGSPHRCTQDSLPDGWPAFPDGIGYPLGPERKVSG